MRDPAQIEACPPALRTLHQYWQGKRQGDALPGRDDIDPIELRTYLGRIAIAELRGGDLIYRLVGSELVEEWGNRCGCGTFSGRDRQDNLGRALCSRVHPRQRSGTPAPGQFHGSSAFRSVVLASPEVMRFSTSVR
ncbi:PAS domain-containing protein [Rhodovibrio sodomensis]|uniref:PAS domain-containing protein n=1 Tax=Rhodovibrio sodomensis TaxID=1088 RepID=UPI001A91A6BE|nr:PAS domain-containing protein [Rhodovibrio sodomensis]